VGTAGVLQKGRPRLLDTKRIPRGWFPEYELVLESAVIRRIFSLWKCKEGATNIFWHPKNKKRLINQQCRGGETGRRARLKILSKSVFTPFF